MQDAVGRLGKVAVARVGWVLLCLVALFVATRIPLTLAIFTIAALIAFGVAPVTFMLERRVPRVLAIFTVYSALLIILAVILVIVVPASIAQAQSLLAQTPVGVERLQGAFDYLQTHLQGHLGKSFAIGIADLRNLIDSRIDALTTTAFASLATLLVSALTSLFVFISAIVLSAFFISRSAAIAHGFRMLFPPERRHLADEFEHEIARVFGGFVAGQVALCVVTGTAVWIALTILKVPFAILIGVVAGFGYAVPFVGMFAVQIGAALLAAPMGTSTVIWVTVVIFVIARIVDNLLVPKIMAQSVGVSPIAVMFAVFAGGELFGVAGLILSIPAAALVKTLWMVYQHARADALAARSMNEALDQGAE